MIKNQIKKRKPQSNKSSNQIKNCKLPQNPLYRCNKKPSPYPSQKYCLNLFRSRMPQLIPFRLRRQHLVPLMTTSRDRVLIQLNLLKLRNKQKLRQNRFIMSSRNNRKLIWQSSNNQKSQLKKTLRRKKSLINKNRQLI